MSFVNLRELRAKARKQTPVRWQIRRSSGFSEYREVVRETAGALNACRLSSFHQKGQLPGFGKSVRTGAPTGKRNVTIVSATLPVSFLSR